MTTPRSRLVVEADGASRGNPGHAAYGALVRDAATGDILVERADYLGETTNNVAEYTGLLEGLRAAHEINPDAQVDVRMDSKLVVEQMSGRWAIKNDALRRIALQARDVFPREQVNYTWIPRAQNSAADALGNEALDSQVIGGSPRIDRRPGAGNVTAAKKVASSRKPTIRKSGAAKPADVDERVTRPQPSLPGWGPDLGSPTLLMLVRHGATNHSLAKRFSGAGGADLPLAEIGRHQARTAAALVESRGGADVIVSSPLLRTRETSQALADRLRADVVVRDEFRECAFGQWDGSTFAEARDRWPDEIDAWLASVDFAPPGGESFAQVAQRVRQGLAELTQEYAGQRVVVVAHVTPIKVIVGETVGAPLESLYRMEIVPGSVSTAAWFADGNSSLRGLNEVGPEHRLT